MDTSNVPPLERPHYVFNTLTAETAESQAPLIEYLTKAQVPFKSYWIANVIVTTTNLSLLTEIAQRDEIMYIEENKKFKVNLETPEAIFDRNSTQKRQVRDIEWNVNYVRARDVWDNLATTGTGFVVANADTGVQYTHEALNTQYRGYDSGTYDHNWNWWDAVHEDGSRCGASSRVPCDDNGHGTHTTGTAVGYDQQNYYIGMAPGAKWIACRNMNAGFGVPQTYIECLQFFVAPTDLNGGNPQPSLAPHVIGNSYGCTPQEGCSSSSLNVAVNNVLTAGIFMSVSAGNSGPSCSSISEPPAIVPGVCMVGALGYNSNSIASFSSRGPVAGRVGPTLAAPGSSVTSAYPTNAYATLSGTSMSSPAVTGAIPLLWQARPSLVRNIPATMAALSRGCQPLASTLCQSPSSGPNNVFGSGLLNIYASIEQSQV
jgi:subtilisin family serine protease